MLYIHPVVFRAVNSLFTPHLMEYGRYVWLSMTISMLGNVREAWEEDPGSHRRACYDNLAVDWVEH